MARGCGTKLLTTVFLLAMVGLFVQLQLGGTGDNFQYGIVLDAGSTHTSLFVYKWPSGKENNTGVVGQMFSCTVKGPGISAYVNDTAAAGESLRSCMASAVAQLPGKKCKSTPVYLGATAGMRLLRKQNPSVSDAILRAVSSVLHSYPLSFRGARILSGQEEGAFSWTTANYLLSNFITYDWFGHWLRPVSAVTVGALDLGGASTQISFVPAETIEVPGDAVRFRLYGYNYTVYTHSYLCYGKDQALKQLLAQLVKDNPKVTSLDNPCYPRGYRVNVTMGGIFGSPCTEQGRPGGSSPGHSLLFVGTGQPHSCQENVQRIFNLTFCSHSHCSFNGVYQPDLTGNFLAFSAFYYTMKFLNLTDPSQKYSADQVNETIWKFCSLSWEETRTLDPTQQEDTLANYCSVANYIYTLLTKGYKFNETSWTNVAFQKQAGETQLGWALGYMLNLTNTMPAEISSSSFSLQIAIISILSTIAILSFVACLCIQLQIRDNGYMPL
ncbi:ectonucleoside triphosphate diphosphohydrolase 2 [Callorhinchus milii]|uniref:ectonucleoside triphosphate diphosphohydrolase 2 n=1 Tax=Callorhinchus milii TaxID=7868 RepID=UPI001C3FF223|nr:ectonucleoside triphosphate diphosphohydrolase 2 [Callorhinchus milii]